MLKRLLFALLLTSATMVEARHAAVALKDPAPVSVPTGMSAADVEKAILTAGASRQWHVTDRKPGSIVLEYSPREFSVKVEVKYDTQTVSFAYAGSSNMEYEKQDGGAVIHPNYNRWVNNLAHDIQGQFTSLLAK